MNFAIFDEDFEADKVQYLKELKNLEKEAIEIEYQDDWKGFVKEHLKDTRNFYLIKTALKAIIQLKNSADFDTAVFSSLSFMPDQTFLETTIMIVARFSNFDNAIASHFNLDITEILKAKNLAKNKPKTKKQNTKTESGKTDKVDKTKSEKIDKTKNIEVVFGKPIKENQLISSKSNKLVPVEKHLKRMTLKKNKK